MADNKISISVIVGSKIVKQGDVIFDIKTSEPYHYKNGVFYTGEIAKNRIKKLIAEHIPPGLINARNINEAYSYIQLMTQTKIRSNKDFICLENGAINIHNGYLTEHKRELMLRHKIRVDYKKDKDYKEWSEFVQGLCETPEAHDTLQEFIGYCFVHGQIAKKLLYIYGGKDSGKSTFYNILYYFFGKYNTSTLSLTDLTDRFLAQNLRFKLVNIRSDIEYRTTPKEVQKIKSLTGGDTQTFDKKFKEDPIEFRNDAKIMLSGNGVPNISKGAIEDPAFVSRWIPIRFPHTFEKKEGIEEKWKSNDGKSQILNWALDGLKRLRKNDWTFSYNPDIERIRDWFLNGQEMNEVDRFLLETYMKSPKGFHPKQEVYDTYLSYCRKKGEHTREPHIFHKMVKNSVFFDIREYQPTIGEKQVKCWLGIRQVQN